MKAKRLKKRVSILLTFMMLISTLPGMTLTAAADSVSLNSGDESSPNPILVVVDNNAANPFGMYMGELLKAEGFNEFETEDINNLTEGYIGKFDLVILTKMSVTEEQSEMLERYVSGGGNLIGLQPDTAKLSELFGISDTGDIVSEGYIKIDTSTKIGKGLESRTMKFHGSADAYEVTSGLEIASLYIDSLTDSNKVAVAVNAYGDGKTAVFSFDLCKSIVYTRQGNPALAGSGPRALDMFREGNGSYNNNAKVDIPQADEQMRLLSHIIEVLNESNKPLPRLWYFPDAKKVVTVFTGDQDFSSLSNLADEFATVTEYGGRASIYMTEGYVASPEQVQAWIDDGHEVGIHYQNGNGTSSSNLTWAITDPIYKGYNERFADQYGQENLPVTVRNHCIFWSWTESDGSPEFAAQAEIEMNNGFKMDCNYYNVYSFQGGNGFASGTGLPMKFAKSNGEILDIYQSDTQLPDEAEFNQGAARMYSNYQAMVSGSVNNGNYAWLNVNFHPHNWGTFKSVALQVLQYARDNGIPVWSAKDMYEFTNMRDNASFSNINWVNNTLSFDLDAPTPGYGNLTVMVPVLHNGKVLKSITQNGVAVDYSIELVKGSGYAFVVTGDGSSSFSAVYSGEAVEPVMLHAIEDRVVFEEDLLSFIVTSDHDDKFPVTYTIDPLPKGAVFDNRTGEFSWRPGIWQMGSYRVTFIVTDGLTADSKTIEINVKSATINLPGNAESMWGAEKTGALQFDSLNYELGTKFETSEAGKITHIKIFGAEGESGAHTARIWRNDTGTVVGGPYTIDFTGQDLWVYHTIPDGGIYIEPGIEYTVSVSTGTDAQRRYTVISNDFANAGDNGKSISYPRDAGVFTETVGARPTESYDSCNYLRDIVFVPGSGTNPNPPVFDEIGNKSVEVGSNLNFTIRATDVDNKPLTYSAGNLPSGAGFNPATQTFDWTPGSNQTGTHNVRFMVSNGESEAVMTVAITVTASGGYEDNAETIWGFDEPAGVEPFGDGASLELGIKFRASIPGTITHVKLWGVTGDTGDHNVHIWDNTGKLVFGPYTINYSGADDWVIRDIPHVSIEAGVDYTISVSSNETGYYPAISGALRSGGDNGKNLSYPDNAGVYSVTPGVIPTTLSTMGSSNYFRDIVFVPDSVPMNNPDTILVVVSDSPANAFGEYMGEILKAEGFNSFKTENINNLTIEYVKRFDSVILTEMPLTLDQSEMLETYVYEGGNLIGLKPDLSLHELFGVSLAGAAVPEGYIRIDTSTQIGKGLESRTMKYHGAADSYALSGGAKIASLYSGSNTDTGRAAVVTNEYGAGKTAVFAYDLCKSIVYMRQGNPALAGIDANGDGPVHAYDLLHGNDGSYSGSWNDWSKLPIPQADEQMRLLSHTIEWLNSSNKPLPRLWYFPDANKAVYVLTDDSDFYDFNNATSLGTGGRDQALTWMKDKMDVIESFGGRTSVYLMDEDMDLVPKSYIQECIASGHEIGIHYNYPNHGSPTWAAGMETFSNSNARLVDLYGIDTPISVRSHNIIWNGLDAQGKQEFAAQAMIELANGIKMDCNYYNRTRVFGFQTGSGLPMKFAKSTGETIDIYQSDTQILDELYFTTNGTGHGTNHPVIPVLLNGFKQMLDRSLKNEEYLWINTNWHNGHWIESRATAIETMKYAVDNDVPIWSAKDMYDFTDMRDNAGFNNIKWEDNTLSFDLDVLTPGYGNLTVMVPALYDGRTLKSITKNNQTVPISIESVKGSSYAFVVTGNGNGSFNAVYSDEQIQQVKLQDIGNKLIFEENPLSFSVTTVHESTFPVSYAIDPLPKGAVFDRQTGEFNWTPGVGQLGTYYIVFSATDGLTTDSKTVEINVKSNLISLADNAEFVWGTEKAGIGEFDSRHYELGTRFSTSKAGKITHVRVFGVEGESGDHTARIWRNDSGAVVGGPYTINFTGQDQWVYYALPDGGISIEPGTEYTVAVSTGTDTQRHYAYIESDILDAGGNGKSISYPANAGVFTETQGARPTMVFNSSNYLRDIVFVPDDGTITNTPVFEQTGNKIVQAGNNLTFTIRATDADNKPLTYSASGLPSGAVFDPATRTFDWTPDLDQTGTYSVQFKASNGEQEATMTVNIAVTGSFDAETIWDYNTPSGVEPNDDAEFNELGTIFRASVAGTITHVKLWGAAGDDGDHNVTIWRNDSSTPVFGPYTINYSGADDWVILEIPNVSIQANVDYTVSVSTNETGYYPGIPFALTNAGSNGKHLSYPQNAGVFIEEFGTRPTKDWNSTNYLRDIVFLPEAAVPPVALDRITVAGYQSEYAVGDTFDSGSFQVTAHYSDGSNKQVTGYSVNPNTLDQAGDQILVTVSYTEGSVTKTANFYVRVKADTDMPVITILDATALPGDIIRVPIAIRNNPGLVSMILDVNYCPALRLTGIEDTGLLPGAQHFIDDSAYPNYPNPYTLIWDNSEASSDFAVNGIIAFLNFEVTDDVGDCLIDVTYRSEDGASNILNAAGERLDFEVRDALVYKSSEPDAELTGITVAKFPLKTVYAKDEALDLTGMVVTATYGDGREKVIANYVTSPIDGSVLSVSGWQTVEVSFTEGGVTRTASFSVNVEGPATSEHIVTFSVDGVTTEVKVTNGNSVVRPADPVPAPGYGFRGWFIGEWSLGAKAFDFDTTITGDITLTAEWFLYGDLDDDDSVTPIDAILMARWVVNWSGLVINEAAADLDGDGFITPIDHIILKRHLVKWKGYEEFPYKGGQ